MPVLLPSGRQARFSSTFGPGTQRMGRGCSLLDLPEPGFDPDPRRPSLDEQKKPVTLLGGGAGHLALSRALGCGFEAGGRLAWSPIRLDPGPGRGPGMPFPPPRPSWRDRRTGTGGCGTAPPGTCWSWPTTGASDRGAVGA